MLAYRVRRLGSGPWVVKLGVLSLSQWATRQQAIDSAVERATNYWSRTPTGFRDIAVYAPTEDGADEIVWTSRTLSG